jgi:hypothetical protein
MAVSERRWLNCDAVSPCKALCCNVIDGCPGEQAPVRRIRGRTRTDPSRMGAVARSSPDGSRSRAHIPIRDGHHLASHRDGVPGRDPAPRSPVCPPARAERRWRLPSRFPGQPPRVLQQSRHSTRVSSLQSSQSQPQHWICTTAQRHADSPCVGGRSACRHQALMLCGGRKLPSVPAKRNPNVAKSVAAYRDPSSRRAECLGGRGGARHATKSRTRLPGTLPATSDLTRYCNPRTRN